MMAGRMTRLASLCLVVMSLSLVAALDSAPVAAATGNGCSDSSTCRWTQFDNHNWPNGSSNPYCGPCISWPPDPNGGGIQNLAYYNGWQGTCGPFENEINWAANTWGSLQYYSPTLYNCNCSTVEPVNYAAKSLPNNECGWTDVPYGNQTQGGLADITQAPGTSSAKATRPSPATSCTRATTTSRPSTATPRT